MRALPYPILGAEVGCTNDGELIVLPKKWPKCNSKLVWSRDRGNGFAQLVDCEIDLYFMQYSKVLNKK